MNQYLVEFLSYRPETFRNQFPSPLYIRNRHGVFLSNPGAPLRKSDDRLIPKSGMPFPLLQNAGIHKISEKTVIMYERDNVRLSL